MPITVSDIGYYKSSNPDSDGGTISASIDDSTLNNVFPDITPKEASGKVVIYRKIFVKNNHPSLNWSDVKFYRSYDPSSDYDQIYLGLGTATDTDGSHVTYYDVDTLGEGLDVGTLAPTATKALWMKRVVTAGKPYKKLNQVTISCEGLTD